MKKELIVQFGFFTAVRKEYSFISFKGETCPIQEKKEVYTTFDGEYYMDFYLYEQDYTITHEYNFGNFSSNHYDQLTHEIICLADKLKTININDIKKLVKKYKNDI